MDNQLTEQILDWIRNRFFGKYRGIVTDNNDATNRGRLKVQVPAVLNNSEVWALPCLPYAGNGVGTYFIPEPGAGVWIEFENGDKSMPVWTGGFWADNQLPQNEQGNGAVPTLRILRSEQGLMIGLDDQAQVITLSDRNGANILTIETQPGKITVKATTKVVVEAPQIELVENAQHPLVFGDDLLTYLNQMVNMFNTHMHPGELAAGVLPVTPAPPVPPLTPPTPDLLSLKVKTG